MLLLGLQQDGGGLDKEQFLRREEREDWRRRWRIIVDAVGYIDNSLNDWIVGGVALVLLIVLIIFSWAPNAPPSPWFNPAGTNVTHLVSTVRRTK